MLHHFAERIRAFTDVESVIDYLLEQAMSLCETRFGNGQLMDWTAGSLQIKTQRGFSEEFLRFFAQVKIEDASVCARALRSPAPVIVEDVLGDARLRPCREILCSAGIRAVQSTPLVSDNGAMIGILSTHFPTPYRPSDIQMRGVAEAAGAAANAIVRIRANKFDDSIESSLSSLQQAREAIFLADKVLSREWWLPQNRSLPVPSTGANDRPEKN